MAEQRSADANERMTEATVVTPANQRSGNPALAHDGRRRMS